MLYPLYVSYTAFGTHKYETEHRIQFQQSGRDGNKIILSLGIEPADHANHDVIRLDPPFPAQSQTLRRPFHRIWRGKHIH